MNFLIVINSSATRDIQIARTPEVADDVCSDEWLDFFGEVVLGVYTGNSKEEAIADAAKINEISAELLDAYELK